MSSVFSCENCKLDYNESNYLLIKLIRNLCLYHVDMYFVKNVFLPFPPKLIQKKIKKNRLLFVQLIVKFIKAT